MPKKDQGISKDRYQIIPRALVFITRDENILLIKGAPHKRLWANQYNGIGGHIERGEDVLSAARRELNEETGLKDVDLHLVATILIDVEEKTGVGIFVFRGEIPADKPVILAASNEGQLEWIPIDQMSTFPLVEDLKTLLPAVLNHNPGEAPRHAVYSYDKDDRLVIRFA